MNDMDRAASKPK